MNNKKVLFILFNNFTNDSRVLKEATTLVNNGYAVTIFCQWTSGLPLIEYLKDIKIIRNFDCNYRIIQSSYPSEMKLVTNKFEDRIEMDLSTSYSSETESATHRLEGEANKTLHQFKNIIKKSPFIIKYIVRPVQFIIRIIKWIKVMVANKTLLSRRKFRFLKHLKSSFNDIDVIQCHDLIALPYGVALKLLHIKKSKVLIYDAHEYETEVGFSVVGSKKKKYEIKERICIKFADHIITVSDSIATAYKKKYKLNKTPTVVLNCPYYKQISNKSSILRDKLNIPNDKIIFIFQGGLCEHRGINLIIEAFRELKGTNKVIVFMGYGALLEIIKKEAQENSNVYYHPVVPPDELLNYTSSANVGLCLYENICLNHYYCLPNKMFEYSMAGLPVIVSNLYELSKIINTYNNGVIISDYSKHGLIKAIESIDADTLKEKLINNNTFNSKYNWEAQEKKLLDIYANTEQ